MRSASVQHQAPVQQGKRIGVPPARTQALPAIRPDLLDPLVAELFGMLVAAAAFRHGSSCLAVSILALGFMLFATAIMLAPDSEKAANGSAAERSINRLLCLIGVALVATLSVVSGEVAGPKTGRFWLLCWLCSSASAAVLVHRQTRFFYNGSPGSAFEQCRRWHEAGEAHLRFSYAQIAEMLQTRQMLRRWPVRTSWLHGKNESLGRIQQTVIDISQPHGYGLQRLLKEVFDKGVATTALVLLLPLLAVIAACIKLTSRGPVIFRQKRLGLNGMPFYIFKFRTMKVHEEKDCVTQACRNDPRLTCIGGFLRRTSLDELPQFFNVLRGEMSIVGPRPHAMEHDELYRDRVPFYLLRHSVKPGITGLAQINGYRGETDTLEKMAKRVEHDLRYIADWSIGLDLRIFLKTAVYGWMSKNTY